MHSLFHITVTIHPANTKDSMFQKPNKCPVLYFLFIFVWISSTLEGNIWFFNCFKLHVYRIITLGVIAVGSGTLQSGLSNFSTGNCIDESGPDQQSFRPWDQNNELKDSKAPRRSAEFGDLSVGVSVCVTTVTLRLVI